MNGKYGLLMLYGVARRSSTRPPPALMRLGTRGSALARWQTDHIASLLGALAGESGERITVEVVVVETLGDRRQDIPIWEMGGKGVFVKEVQAAVLDVELAGCDASEEAVSYARESAARVGARSNFFALKVGRDTMTVRLHWVDNVNRRQSATVSRLFASRTCR